MVLPVEEPDNLVEPEKMSLKNCGRCRLILYGRPTARNLFCAQNGDCNQNRGSIIRVNMPNDSSPKDRIMSPLRMDLISNR